MTPTLELEYWQARLNLPDWKVSIKYGKVKPGNDAEILYDTENLTASIVIREGKRGAELSWLVMHELLHLVVAPLADIATGKEADDIAENVVEHFEAIMKGIDE